MTSPMNTTYFEGTLQPSTNITTLTTGGFEINPIFRGWMYVMYSVVFISGLFGNGAVIYIVAITCSTMTTSEKLMTSLAVADLLASFFSPIVMVYDLVVPNGTWYLGAVLCKILPAFNNITVLASAWNMVVIALDRCR